MKLFFLRFPSLLHILWFLIVSLALATHPTLAWADSDEAPNTAAGLQPISAPLPRTHHFPRESHLFARDDGTYQAIPETHGRTKLFRFVEREAPWTLKPGLTVMAKTYNGVVPGPTILVNQGDHVVIELLNALTVADTLHLHGVRGGSVEMDGVGGLSQPMIQPGAQFRYEFDARQSGTFMYHSHGGGSMLDSGLYGGIIVSPNNPRPEEIVSHDYLQIISAWNIQSLGENHFTLNGKSYPATKALEITEKQRIRIRWVNISGENDHTMHTHGHDQLVIARDAQPLPYRDLEDTVLLGPGQRVDVVVTGNAKPGTWLVHCHIFDHVEDANAMPDGLITALHYTGTPNTLTAMYDAMPAHMSVVAPKQPTSSSKPKILDLTSVLILATTTSITLFATCLLMGSRRLPRKTLLCMHAVAGVTLIFLVVQIVPNLSYPLMQGMWTWADSSRFPYFTALALLSGLTIGFIGTSLCASYATTRDVATRTFVQGLAIGSSAASGATMLTLTLVIGFTLYNATLRAGTLNWKHIITTALLAPTSICLGALLGYTVCSPVSVTFFLALTSGTLIYTIGSLAAEMLVIVSGYATDGERP